MRQAYDAAERYAPRRRALHVLGLHRVSRLPREQADEVGDVRARRCRAARAELNSGSEPEFKLSLPQVPRCSAPLGTARPGSHLLGGVFFFVFVEPLEASPERPLITLRSPAFR